ncbi:hypothetical protein EJ04DRAFT_306292 [Polyplosphaeria fusca]|uniref:Uncharacterized protein n=1 Tax=Polyplosphaeria fusca TaxID=682080 RepID=A0A9P4UZM6_9PLEO|nr:hypothetical protein EJ04DRAFT_306292 [Polyplosphaeria fusca]
MKRPKQRTGAQRASRTRMADCSERGERGGCSERSRGWCDKRLTSGVVLLPVWLGWMGNAPTSHTIPASPRPDGPDDAPEPRLGATSKEAATTRAQAGNG